MPRPKDEASDELDCTTQSEEAVLGAPHLDQQLVPALTVLYHRDGRQIGKQALLRELAFGREMALSRVVPHFAPVDHSAEPEPLGDPRLSRQPLRIVPLPLGGLRLVFEPSRTRVRYRG